MTWAKGVKIAHKVPSLDRIKRVVRSFLIAEKIREEKMGKIVKNDW